MARSIATNHAVDLPALLEFVRPRHRLLLATTRSDGRPQMSPVSGGVVVVGGTAGIPSIVMAGGSPRVAGRDAGGITAGVSAGRDLRVPAPPRDGDAVGITDPPCLVGG